MRDILFKGKRIDNGEWVEGHYYAWKYFNGKGYELKNSIKNENGEFVVIPETVCQLLFISNNNRFFDGDIIKKIKSDQLWVIIWNSEINNYSCLTSYEYNMTKNNEQCEFVLNSHSAINYQFIKRNDFYPIGSIHDNPNLIK